MPQYQGVWSLQSAAQLQSTQRWVTDPLFENTTLLLQADDAPSGAQNNTFFDSSGNNFTITRNGNATQGTFAPFSLQPGAWSNYFDGSGDYLVTPSNSAFDPSGQNITVDFWIYLTRYATTQGAVFEVGNAAVGDMQCLIGNTGYVAFQIGGTAGSFVYGFTLNTWHYVTCVKSGTNFTAYLNGVAGTTVSMSPNSKTTLTIGAQGNGANAIDGYISSFRYVRGSANIPTSIPNAPLTNITNTSLLTCQSNRFVDNGTANSGSGFALTVNGNPSIQPFSPFAPQYQWTSSVIGGSGYFDGSGDSISVSSTNTLFNIGASVNFTYEAWFYSNSAAAILNIISLRQDGSGWAAIEVQTNTNRTISLNISQSGGSWQTTGTSTATFNLNSWNHVAVVRAGGSTINLYLNGVSILGPFTNGNALYSTPTEALRVASRPTGGNLTGYVAGVRFIRGQALATGNFTPPTAPVTPTTVGWTGANAAASITGTVVFLCNFSNAAIYDGTMKNNLETVANAQISTAVVKYGNGSMSFDGTTDCLFEPSSVNYGYGTGDFTIEFWVRLNATTTQTIVSNLSSNTGTSPHIYYSNGANIRYYTAGADRITGNPLNINQWYHIAVCRASNVTRMFIDGVQVGSSYADTNNYGTSNILGVGDYVNAGVLTNTSTLNGYIDDLRITRGVARYTANFIPPSVALPRQ